MGDFEQRKSNDVSLQDSDEKISNKIGMKKPINVARPLGTCLPFRQH